MDALLTAQYSAGLNPIGFQVGLADVSGDQSVNIYDALLIAQYTTGIIIQFPINVKTPTPTPINTTTPTCGTCTFTYSGKVSDANGQPIAGATIYTAYDLPPAGTTDAGGKYSVSVKGLSGGGCPYAADGFIIAKASGYQTKESPWFSLMGCVNGTWNFVLQPAVTPTPTPAPTPTPTCESCLRYMSGTVKNASGVPIANAAVSEMGGTLAVTNAQGVFSYTRSATKPSMYGCPTGDTYLIVKASGYKDVSSLVTVDCGTYSYNFTLVPVTP